MVLGMSKGTVIFLPVDEINKVYTRVSVHRQAIDNVLEIPGADTFVSSA
jgi:hypothetical protein